MMGTKQETRILSTHPPAPGMIKLVRTSTFSEVSHVTLLNGARLEDVAQQWNPLRSA